MMSKENGQKEMVLVRYYNVMFYLVFNTEKDEIKKNTILELIDTGAKVNMKQIYSWCKI